MADHIGFVIKNDSGKYAQVITNRKSACGGCQSSPHSCGSCLTNSKMESRVANPLGAEPGDLVEVRLSSGNLFAGAAILYLLPILVLMLGAFLGTWASTLFGVTEISGSIGGAVTGLVIGYTAVIGFDRSQRIRRRIMPTITAILTPKVDLPKTEKASCCG